jgi:ribonuclease BN (tRNA processing enzyme)
LAALSGRYIQVVEPSTADVMVTFAGSGDAFGSSGRLQACIHLRWPAPDSPALLDCGATSLAALKRCGLDPGDIGAVFVSHLHGDHFAGLPFLILDGQFSGRVRPLTIAGPAGFRERLATAMDCLFPGSWETERSFPVQVRELAPGATTSVDGVTVTALLAEHPSGAPALILRLTVAGRTIAYTGDTAWTPMVPVAAADADLLIAEAYYRDKAVPHHLSLADLEQHRADLLCQRIVLTHMSADMLAAPHQPGYEYAADGLVLRL